MGTEDIGVHIVHISRVIKWESKTPSLSLEYKHGCLHAIDFIMNCCNLTHWGRVMHICVSKLTIIGSDNGLLPLFLNLDGSAQHCGISSAFSKGDVAVLHHLAIHVMLCYLKHLLMQCWKQFSVWFTRLLVWFLFKITCYLINSLRPAVYWFMVNVKLTPYDGLLPIPYRAVIQTSDMWFFATWCNWCDFYWCWIKFCLKNSVCQSAIPKLIIKHWSKFNSCSGKNLKIWHAMGSVI